MAYQSTAEFPVDSFTAADWQALSGRWASIGQQAQAVADESDNGEIDDDLAFASPWGVDLPGMCGTVDLYQAVDDRIIPPASRGPARLDDPTGKDSQDTQFRTRGRPR